MTNPVIDTGIPEEVKDKIIGIISTVIPECKIYLYGSRARGKFSRCSDVDIVLDGGKRLERLKVYEAQELMHALLTTLKINLADFYELPESYQISLNKDKILWK